MLKKISMIAVPSILQQSFVSVGNIFIQSLVNSFGSSVIAGYSAAIKLNTFSITCFTTLGNGVSSFTAQNLGAGKVDPGQKGPWGRYQNGAADSDTIFYCLLYFWPEYGTIIYERRCSALASVQGLPFLRIGCSHSISSFPSSL